MVKSVFALCCLLMAVCLLPSSATEFSVVTPDWVASHVNDSDVRILDVRAEPYLYFTGHVPNAVHLADNTLRGTSNGVPVQYLPPELMAQILARAGVTSKNKVVVYSDGDNVLGATMVSYALERLGHPSVMFMDGGWTAYKSKHTVSQQYPTYQIGSLPAGDNKSLYVTFDELKNLVGKPGIVFVDARPSNVYSGEVQVWMRNGHIPGAINCDWHELVDAKDRHRLKSVEEMRAVISSKGIKPNDNIIVYCGTSREATLEFLVMRHLLKFPNVRLYEGSWAEYCSYSDMPVETGKQKTVVEE